MTKPRRMNVQPWAVAVEEILADGEWHDGRRVLLQGMRVIEPGVAQREAERTRAAASGAPEKRQKPVSVDEQIRVGKRRLMSALMNGRLRMGTWESDPPYPMGEIWTGPSFKLRDLRARMMSVPELAAHCQVPVSTIDTVIRQTAVAVERRGKNRQIAKADLPKFEDEVKRWVAETSARRAESTRKAMRTRAKQGRNMFTPTTVAAIESVLGHDPDMPARERLERVAEQAREAEELRTALWVCRDELARLVAAHGDDDPGEKAVRAVDQASRLLDLTGGLFPKEGS